MAEAFGSIAVKLPLILHSNLLKSKQIIAADLIKKLLKHANIQDEAIIESFTSQQFEQEGLESIDEYLFIDTMGTNWIELLNKIVELGKGIEIYALIEHEEGYQEYFAINDHSKTFRDLVDFEDEDGKSYEEVMPRWLEVMPQDIAGVFFDMFEGDEEDDDEA
ncbi:hypothetical protein [Marinicellulosiphila megalodicopiae]|uniref:hypothetical protein n=1 Tax=Marinicellulosiphila megalodicopiae TaxID=2724896 RepID=UPI003BAEEFF8